MDHSRLHPTDRTSLILALRQKQKHIRDHPKEDHAVVIKEIEEIRELLDPSTRIERPDMDNLKDQFMKQDALKEAVGAADLKRDSEFWVRLLPHGWVHKPRVRIVFAEPVIELHMEARLNYHSDSLGIMETVSLLDLKQYGIDSLRTLINRKWRKGAFELLDALADQHENKIGISDAH